MWYNAQPKTYDQQIVVVLFPNNFLLNVILAICRFWLPRLIIIHFPKYYLILIIMLRYVYVPVCYMSSGVTENKVGSKLQKILQICKKKQQISNRKNLLWCLSRYDNKVNPWRHGTQNRFPPIFPYVRGINRWPVDSPRQGPVMRSFDFLLALLLASISR